MCSQWHFVESCRPPIHSPRCRIWCDQLVPKHDIRERHINSVYFNFSVSRSYIAMLFHEYSILASIVWISFMQRTPDFKPFRNNWAITVILHHGGCDYLHLDSFFHQFVQANKNEPSKLRIIGPMLWESTSDRWIPLTKGQSCRKSGRHYVMNCWRSNPVVLWVASLYVLFMYCIICTV